MRLKALKTGHRELHPSITPEKRENLKRLATFLNETDFSKYSTQFKMSRYAVFRNDAESSAFNGVFNACPVHECQTSACAVGWGPTAGILPRNKRDSNVLEDWDTYCTRVFCSAHSGEWSFLFGPCHVDCPKAAARRIFYLLQHGMPLYFDREQGEIPEEMVEVE